MNSSAIRNALSSNSITKPSFRGVFSADSIQSLEPLPGACVINTDPSDKPGMHWIAIYQSEPQVIETFDSFGEDFAFYEVNVYKGFRIVKQTDQLQSFSSTVCG